MEEVWNSVVSVRAIELDWFKALINFILYLVCVNVFWLKRNHKSDFIPYNSHISLIKPDNLMEELFLCNLVQTCILSKKHLRLSSIKWNMDIPFYRSTSIDFLNDEVIEMIFQYFNIQPLQEISLMSFLEDFSL